MCCGMDFDYVNGVRLHRVWCMMTYACFRVWTWAMLTVFEHNCIVLQTEFKGINTLTICLYNYVKIQHEKIFISFEPLT